MNRKINKKMGQDNPQNEQKMQVHYFHIRGKCQPIRNLLYYLNVEFDDIMHDNSVENQSQVGFNMGLPKIVDNDIVVHQAIACMSYICMKYDKSYLIGQTPQTIAKTQQVLMKYSMQRNKIFGIMFQSFKNLNNTSNKQLQIQTTLKRMLSQCKFIQYGIKSFIKNKSYIFGNITIADFVFYEICYYLVGFYQDYMKNNLFYRYFIQYKNFFQTLPFFEKQRQKISQKYLFYQYKNERINTQIQNLWKGSNSNIIKRSLMDN